MERLLDRRGFLGGLMACAVGGPRLLFGKAAIDPDVDLRNHDPNRSWITGYADD